MKLREELIPFTAGDGFQCNLLRIRGEEFPSRGPVVLVHGAGVRGNIFRPPVGTTLVEYLIQHGYEVWLENWRASIDLPPNLWTLDQAALYDHPKAVQTIVRETGCRSLKAIIHCQGSTSFMMAAMAGLVPQVTTIISNAVSLHPVVPAGSLVKSKVALPLVARLTPYLNPQWGLHAPTVVAKFIALIVRLTHRECQNEVCKQVSFTYGYGFPALWRHENLNEETHEWLKHEFAHVPIRFFQQIMQCIRKGHLVAVEGKRGLPADFLAQKPQTDARIAFFAGELNRCFLAESQQRSFDYFSALRKDFHSLYVLPGYSHLDVFMGKNAHRDVFPLMLKELERAN